jgi:NTP pyrophosphatase (non-canonical NTP hydrolase)
LSNINNIDNYQSIALSTSKYKSDGLKDIVLGLNEEAGEAAGKVKKVSRDNNGVWTSESEEAFIKELGDVLWYVAVAASLKGYRLSEVAQMNVDKLADREERGTIHGSGDNR